MVVPIDFEVNGNIDIRVSSASRDGVSSLVVQVLLRERNETVFIARNNPHQHRNAARRRCSVSLQHPEVRGHRTCGLVRRRGRGKEAYQLVVYRNGHRVGRIITKPDLARKIGLKNFQHNGFGVLGRPRVVENGEVEGDIPASVRRRDVDRSGSGEIRRAGRARRRRAGGRHSHGNTEVRGNGACHGQCNRMGDVAARFGHRRARVLEAHPARLNESGVLYRQRVFVRCRRNAAPRTWEVVAFGQRKGNDIRIGVIIKAQEDG